MTYETVEETFSYTLTSLVADFGGMLGLLLGASGGFICLVTIHFLTRLVFLKFSKIRFKYANNRDVKYEFISMVSANEGSRESLN